ncbi:DNA polymerase III subunit gamma and tau [Demequina lutea]|uniref:DNA polymerase III subunit gamma/tau n=1 Tax=Demequina lutea TaxID=431489 RepID=A0A7Y9ZEJ2_9MICO|nr:DNA polymerase III subunit gamma and tau [Demequina lutea]NYI42520.1 DNA polymerase-3 subunit gamma/tau [Demequina lutea]
MTTALYRRYRPDTFADLVGQEHVTVPLMQALKSDRVAHAYLFSGPRGCGKTTSARILARCLNCAEGPTDTPCGKCDSCIELARGGSGSVDVVEIDAASHNGVDDARELRERAAFAPARDRYKIFILDEAHMVTTQGFNALLKLVEEPPPHVRFVFATTEPDKVIGTIRSRTHHYPFRLVPPGILTDYMAKLADAEGATIASGVLPLVVRAGGGSVRDSLSVLDQLIAGSGEGGVTYERAISLLGFTDATLLDDAVDAIAAADGASLFGVVSRVIETGHEPRRFVEDLLERLRDLIVLAASGQAGVQALAVDAEDARERLIDQSRRLGLVRASRAGDLVNDALTAMIGATSPRLHLELLCARLIAADAQQGAAVAVTAVAPAAAAAPVAKSAPAQPATATPVPAQPVPAQPAPAQRAAPAPASHRSPPPWEVPDEPVASAMTPPAIAQVASPPAPSAPPTSAPAGGGLAAARAAVAAAREETARDESATSTVPVVKPAAASAPSATRPAATSTPSAAAESDTVRAPTGDVASGPEDAALVRRRWDEVLGTLERRRVTWTMVKQSGQVASVEGGVLKLAFDNPALAARFSAGAHAENVALAVRETLGLHVRVEGVVGPAGGAGVPVTSSAPHGASQRASGASSEPPMPDEPPSDDEDMSADDAQAPSAHLTGADVIASMLGGTIIND